MEQVHGVDVSWMTHGSPKGKCRLLSKRTLPLLSPPEQNNPRCDGSDGSTVVLTLGTDKSNNNNNTSPSSKTPAPAQPRQIPTSSPGSNGAQPSTDSPTPNGSANGHAEAPSPSNGINIPKRPGRSASIDGKSPTGTPPGRRNSWFSNISAKFSSSSPPVNGSPPPQPPLSPTDPAEPAPPKITPTKNAVLQHASRHEGNGPYTPAPPRSGPPGFLGVFRRLSSSSNGGLGAGGKLTHGLVERKTLNVDQARERCPISELQGAKLRRVAFSVDVEIAPMPRYAESDTISPKTIDKSQKKKLTEKGEGEALKNPKTVEAQKESDGVIKTTGESLPKEPAKEGQEKDKPTKEDAAPVIEKEKDTTKKKEKKKKSEEERKARKEKKRKLAEANGSIPMEIHYDSSDSTADDDSHSGKTTQKTTAYPTTNPVRVYRRCCQLRETPILKKITEQLTNNTNVSTSTGLVEKLDLTGYWLQLPDLITLGDYLAVVPVKEVLLENSGLSDEGLRVILAGLLAAKKPATRRRKPKHEHELQGGVVERLVLKNNKLGPDGWKHLSLFLYLCRSLKYLDVSNIPFPRQPQTNQNGTLPNGAQLPRSISDIFSKALGERLGGSDLELVNFGETGATVEQLGAVIDGLIKCGVRRLGLAHSHIDDEGMQHVVKFLKSKSCEGLDLGGNELADSMETLASAINEDSGLKALGLAGCGLTPSSLCKILPALIKLKDFRFIDLSHNHALFESTPSAVGLLRRYVTPRRPCGSSSLTVSRYIPKMVALRRIHLEDVEMTAEQTIALVEIVPESPSLAHISIRGNSELLKLADAQTEEAQEEACALYASLLSAARVSRSIICVDIEVPSDKSGEIVKAMAKQVVAYCLRNMERFHDADVVLSEPQQGEPDDKLPPYPDVLVHLVGHDVLDGNESGDDGSAPDEDYVIGGTGVVKALTCCLQNRGDESRRQSGEFIRDVENGVASPRPALTTGGKAKDMSKHLLASARKIQLRLQPALSKARAHPEDEMGLRKLIFLDDTLKSIIKRFEDEYPDTRESAATRPRASTLSTADELSISVPSTEDAGVALSDNEDESDLHGVRPSSRSNSTLSRSLAKEEGRILRAGHRFRVAFLNQEQINLLNTIDDIGSDPKHVRMLHEMAEDLGGEILELANEKGALRAFREHKELAFRSMEESDPDHWARFVESQQKAQANITVPSAVKNGETPSAAANESAIAD